jgi:hypothetical protein
MNDFFLLALTLVSSVLAAYGSLLFIDRDGHPAQYGLGAIVFTVANAINIAVGLHIGDLVLVSSQAGLMWFTLPMYENKRFSMVCSGGFIALICILGVAKNFHFTASYLGAACSIIAISGAWFMSRGKFTPMAWCWLIADLGFIVVAVLNKLPMLGVLALVFVYHSSLRLLGYKRTGLFTFVK